MNILRRSALLLFTSTLAFGQGSQLPKYTVATLPTASSQITYTVQVIDGTTNTDCTIGGASGHSAFNVICSVRWNGSAYVWSPVNTTAGGGGPGAATYITADGTGTPPTNYQVLTAGSNITLTPNAGAHTMTIASTSGGSGTVTEVDTNATSGISGGPITTTGTVACSQATTSQFGCVKPDGTTITASGGVLSAVSSGGGGLLPSGTALLVGSFSGLNDDGDSNSRDLGTPNSVTCVHTTTSTCTVVFGSSHGLSATKGAIDMHSLASWPAGISGGVQQAAQYGSFQVTTVPNGTTITFTTPTTLTYTCSPCTGHAFDASQWGIWQFAFQPGINGVATVYQVETTTQTAAANVGTWLAAISGSPKYYIDQTGQNDFSGGRTVAQVNADHQTVWAAVHTAGAKVLQSTMMPAQYGLTGVNILPMEANYFEWLQSRGISDTMKGNGQYVDLYADTASAGLMALNATSQPTQTANQLFASTVARVLLTQTSDQYPPLTGTYSNSGLGSDIIAHLNYQPELFYDQNNINWMEWGQNAGGPLGIDLYSYSFTTGPPSMIRLWQSGLGAGSDWCASTIGRDTVSVQNYFANCIHYVSNGSPLNYKYTRAANVASSSSDNIRQYADGTTSFPGSLGTTPSTSPVCPNGTNGTLTTTGCSGGSSGLSGMTAGQVPIAATASTVTSSKAIQGTDTNLLSSGTISGTGVTLCTDANGGATTSGCPSTSLPANAQGFLLNDGSGGLSWSLGGGATVKTTNYTALISDGGLFVMNCGSACALTLPASSIPAGYNIAVQAVNTGAVTIAPNGNTVYLANSTGTTSSITVPQGQTIYLGWDGTAFRATAPLLQGTNVTITPSSTGLTFAATAGGAGVSSFSGDGALLSNSSSTGGVTATLANAAAHKFWGNNTGSTAAPGYESITAADLTGIRQWSCQPGLGDGLNAITSGTYLSSTCMNTTGATVTITGLKCFTDNSGSSTMNAAGNTLGALLTGAVTCSSAFAAGTQSANVALTNGDYIKFTFVADGTSKQTTWVVTGTY